MGICEQVDRAAIMSVAGRAIIARKPARGDPRLIPHTSVPVVSSRHGTYALGMCGLHDLSATFDGGKLGDPSGEPIPKRGVEGGHQVAVRPVTAGGVRC